MIQLYARHSDLITQETVGYHTLTDWTEDHLPHYESIKEVGIRRPLCVNPNGTISYGNGRHFIARNLGIEYVPINLQWYLGLRVFGNNTLGLRDSMYTQFMRPISDQDATLPINLHPHIYQPNYHETLGRINYYKLEFIDSLLAEPDHHKSNIQTVQLLRRNVHGLC